MTVKELIERLKEFPENMTILNYEYFDVVEVYKEAACDCDTEYVIIN